MARSLVLFFLLLFSILPGYGQNTGGDLAVQREAETDPAPFVAQITQSQSDTNKVKLLCKIARISWYKRTKANQAVDSTLIFARQAFVLSKDLHFTEGRNEASFLICKALTEKKDFAQAIKLTNEVYGEQQARLLLTIAESFVFHSPPNDKELANAMPLIKKAKQISDNVPSLRWSSESLNLLAKLRFNQGDFVAGKQTVTEVIATYHKLKDYNNEAKYWSRLGSYMPESSNTFLDIIHSREMAVHYYLLAGNKKEAGYSLRELAMVRGNHNQTVQAEKDLMQMLRLFASVHEKLTANTFYIISEYYRFTGKYDKALYYGLEALKAAGDNEDKKINPCIALASIYGLLKDYKNALMYYQIVLDYYEKRNSPNMFTSCYKVVRLETESGNPRRALALLNKFIAGHPTASLNHQQLFASCYGDIYRSLGNYNAAEQYYRRMLNLDGPAEQENSKNIGYHLTLVGGGAYYIMGKFYAETSRFKEAKPFLLKSLNNPQYFDKDQEFDTYKLLFKVDSAMGDYLSAIKYFQVHRAMSDSINSVATANKISALNIQYETAQKAKDIKLLENKQRLQQAAVQKSDTIRDFTIGISILLLLLASSLYLGYRNKQRSNSQLQIQRDEINEQNTRLQALLAENELFLTEKDGLIEEKDSLLKEKDWLLREVHHRVKNNLQIIMSLLRTQLANLKNDDARGAIIESENRVQAIALIHQKLYNTDKLASISMPAYVSELINYLSDSLATKDRQVRFHQSIDPIYLDLAQAVPLGLILNEAITNAIKYGFNENGIDISIVFRCLEHTKALLVISDKGKGLPEGFDPLMAKSLGMKMIKGLSKQLKGLFSITSDQGVTITIKFNLVPVFSAISTISTGSTVETSSSIPT